MRRVTYTQQAPTASAPAAQPTISQPAAQPAPSALQERIRAASYAGFGVGGLLFIVLAGGYVALAQVPVVKTIGTLALVAVVAGILAFFYFLISWSIQTASRDWRVDHAERKRRWRLEDEDRSWAREQAAQAQEAAQPPPLDLTWIHQIALKILERHQAGQKVTRAECTRVGLCDQTQWNLVNRVFKAIGFKRGNTFSPPKPLPLAWGAWLKHVSIYDEEIWCRNIDPKKKNGIEILTFGPAKLDKTK